MAEKPYERYAWVLLAATEILGILFALLNTFATTVMFSLSSSEALGPTTTALLSGASSLVGGMYLFGLAITLKPYRNGEKWAWYTLWYFPVVFTLHFILLFPALENVLFAVLPFLGLVLPYRKFFPKKQA